MSNDFVVRAATLSIAAAFVAGAMLTLGSYSNAKFNDAASTVRAQYDSEATEVAIAPSRIEVVGKRATRTLGAAPAVLVSG